MKTKVTLGMMMAIALASCTQEEALTFDYGEKTLHVSVESTEISSRVGFTDGEAKFFWTKNDAIGVTTTSAKKSFQKMTFQGNGGEATGDFKGSISGDPSGYAVYPSNSSHKMSGSALTYSLPDTYSYTMLDDTYANATGNSHNMPMWAEIKDGAAAFKHLGGVAVVEINDLPENTSGLTFTFTASSKINGTFTVDLTETEPVLTTSSDNVSDAEKEVTITFSTAENQTKGYFYVPVPIGTYDWNVKVTDGEGVQKAQGIWEEKEVERKDIYRLKIGESTIVGGEDNTKTVSSVSNITDQVLSTTEENLTVKVTGEVSGTENTITIPSTLQTEVTTFSFTSIADDAAITIENVDGASYEGQIIIEIPEDETIPTVTATVPDGEVYIKQGTVTTLVTSSAENTTIIGANAAVGTLTVVKGNVRIEDGGKVTTIQRSEDNDDDVTYIIYEGTIPNGVTSTDAIKHISAAEWDLRKAIENNNEVKLGANITLTDAITINKAVTIDLNGYTIENKSASITTGIGSTADESIVFYVDGSAANLTLNATNGGKVIATGDGSKSYYNVAVWVTNGATATINGGEYSNTADPAGDGCDLIYGRDGGKIFITGGTFKAGAISKTLGGGIYGVLNCKDNTNSTITVSGGKFYEYGAAEAAKVGKGEVILLEGGYYWSAKDADGYYTVTDKIETEEALKSAIANNDKVELGANITLTDAITINKAVTIDLNGYTIENKSASITTGIGSTADESIVFYVDGAEANLTLNATNGGKVIATGDGSKSYYNVAVWVTNGATATINGGEYSNTADPAGDGCDLIYGRDGGKIFITGGTFKAGAISKTLGGGIYGVLNCKDNTNSTITVSGGKFYEYGDAEAAKVGNGEVILLEGGYYWSEKDADGYYTVTDKIETEEALKSAIAKNDEVKLGANITLTEAISINKSVTIDLNGYTIENKSASITTGLGSTADESIVFYVDGSAANLTLNATNGGKVIATGDGSKSYYNVAVWVTNGATATINGGEYSNTADPAGDGCDLIYGRDGGKIFITGGTFKAGAISKTLGGGIYGVLNCKDNTNSTITVSGGKFYEYGAEHAAAVGNGEVILLEGGYKWSEKDSDNYYSVVSAND